MDMGLISIDADIHTKIRKEKKILILKYVPVARWQTQNSFFRRGAWKRNYYKKIRVYNVNSVKLRDNWLKHPTKKWYSNSRFELNYKIKPGGSI